MCDYSYELITIREILRELVDVLKDIRDKMPPQEGNYSIAGGDYS